MRFGIEQTRDGDASDILVRGRRVRAVPVRIGINAEVCCHAQHHRHEVVIREITWVNDDVRRARYHGEKPVRQPTLTRVRCRMRRTREPLGHADDRFEASFIRCDREGRAGLQRMRVKWKREVCTLRAVHRRAQAVDVEKVRDGDLGAEPAQRVAAVVATVHEGSYRVAPFEQLPGDGVSGFTGRAGNENRMHVGSLPTFTTLVVYATSRDDETS